MDNQKPQFIPHGSQQKQQSNQQHPQNIRTDITPHKQAEGTLRFIPIGGVGDVTKNMYIYETPDEILIVDCGIGFPKEEMYGVDLLIPDISYLLDKKDKIKGLLLTHGHEDHIGALPYILPSLPNTFPIYATTLTAGLANAKLLEWELGTPIKTVEYNKPIKIGNSFTATFIHVTHSIPDAANIAIETPAGAFFHASDFKFDLTPVDNQPSDLLKIAEFGKKGMVALFSDCLRAEDKGMTESERTIEQRIEEVLMNCKGKFIMTTYSSNISRIQQAVNAAMRFKRRVVFAGRSMNQAKDVALRLGFLSIPQGVEVPLEKAHGYSDPELLFVVAGSQGQENSAMSRIAAGEDKYIKIKPDDMVVFSADPIPGNENAVNSLIDGLSKRGAKVVYSDINDSFHVSGHGAANDLMLMMQLTNPKFLLPIGGTYKHMVQYRNLAEDSGFERKNVFLVDDGQVIEFSHDKAIMREKINVRNVYVDDMEGKEVHQALLFDRKKLAEDGMLLVIIQMDMKEGRVYGDIDIISRGFMDLQQNKPLVTQIKSEIQKVLHDSENKEQEWHYMRKKIEHSLERFFAKKLRKQPLILPIIVEV